MQCPGESLGKAHVEEVCKELHFSGDAPGKKRMGREAREAMQLPGAAAGETYMKKLHPSIVCVTLLPMVVPVLRAQDLSTYRSFSIGSTLTGMLKQTGSSVSSVQLLHAQPATIQEFTLWPSATPVSTRHPDAVERIQFSFFNGELYKIYVVYDQRAVQGLTDDDMLHLISTIYGPGTSAAVTVDPAADTQAERKQNRIASWEDRQFAIQLFRNSVVDNFGLILLSKRVNAQAEAAIVEAAKLEAQERPQKEADQRKKEAADLELLRQKNKQTFRP